MSQAKLQVCLFPVFSASLDGFGDERDAFVWCSVPVTVWQPFSFGFTTPKKRFRDSTEAVLRHPDCSFACENVPVSFAWILKVKSPR